MSRKTNGIIKNYKKFKIVKVPKGLDLRYAKFSPRQMGSSFTSTSTKKYGRWWFEIDNKKAIFKTFDSEYNKQLRELRMTNELICQALADQVGINHAKYEPASMGHDNGLLSYNFANKNQKN